MTNNYHCPVLLQASVDGLLVRPDGAYVDVTFGGGGHSKEILRRLNRAGHLYSFDQDNDAEQNINDESGLFKADNFTFVRSNFRYLKNWMRYYGVNYVDGILADLGVSSHHFDDETRGFSFRFDAPLDMRMNGRGGQTAANVLNEYTTDQLASILYIYGELKNGRKIAESIDRFRALKPFENVGDLIEVVRPFMGKAREKKDMAKVFQALRIEVNHEMDALREMLEAAIEVLRPGGRLAVLTYHSLEDRIVKNYMRAGNAEGKAEQDFYGHFLSPLRLVNNKVIIPDETEQNENPRSRSAKLRIAEKI